MHTYRSYETFRATDKKYPLLNDVLPFDYPPTHKSQRINYNKIRRIFTPAIIPWFILILGVVLALIQWCYNRSIWLDEGLLALNIIHRTPAELLQPLDNLQSAPILFLWIERLFGTLIPNTEMGLRFFPMLCFVAACVFFCKMLRRESGIPTTSVAMGFFAFNYWLLSYSAEAKQYCVETCVAVVLLYLITKTYKTQLGKCLTLSIVGVMSVFMSNTAVIMLFTCGCYLLYQQLSTGNITLRRLAPLLGVAATWIVSLVVCYVVFVSRNNTTREMMHTSWIAFGGFLSHHPQELFSGNYLMFIVNRLGLFISNVLPTYHIVALAIITLLILAGMLSLLLQKRWGWLILTIMPIVIIVLLSFIQLYPIARRLVFFCTPGLILLFTSGVSYLAGCISSKVKQYSPLLAILPLAMVLTIGFPIQRENFRGAITFVQDQLRPNEQIVGARPSTLRFYSDIGVIKSSTMNQVDTSATLMDNLTGKVWYIVSTPYGGIWDGYRYSPRHVGSNLERRLDSLGYQPIKRYEDFGAAAYLYDFK
ncbi:MAG: glycosyltransferase family 39 protein [Culturomica sp.]|jgi:hypothetical protein|nr:glycosyltransferase family 39 protein [Culturomica sp.]